MGGTQLMIIKIQQSADACAYLFKTREDYIEWAKSEFTNVELFEWVRLKALHGTEFEVSGVYANPKTGLFYVVKHYDTPQSHTIRPLFGTPRTVYYTSWVIPQPYFST